MRLRESKKRSGSTARQAKHPAVHYGAGFALDATRARTRRSNCETERAWSPCSFLREALAVMCVAGLSPFGTASWREHITQPIFAF